MGPGDAPPTAEELGSLSSGRARSVDGVVQRRRLFDLLQRGTEGPVTLVTGPAGSGKTMLAASWLQAGEWPGPVARVSVEPDELDAARFWRSVVAALHLSGAATGIEALETLTPPPDGTCEPFVRRLAEGLDEVAASTLLVIDDLPHLVSEDALKDLAALLRLAPHQLRVILMGRREPQVGLHRLRVAGELTEISAADLEFTIEEASELLSSAGADLAEDGVAALRDRTEGWAAGLRLAAMSLAGGRDPERLVWEFSGSERTVADYLIGEVLANQPPAVRAMLLRTSLLNRVNGDLANLLAGLDDGARMLHELEDANAFVTSIDAGRTWFRYHQLLADLLRLELRHEAPTEIDALHRTAARWLADHGLPVEAIRQAEASKDWAYAGDLLMENWFSLFLDGEQTTIRALLAALPSELVRSDPELAAIFAADRLADGRLEHADSYIATAERLSESVPEPHRPRFDATLAVVKLTRARSRGDFDAAVEGAHGILSPSGPETWADVVSNEDVRALALMNLGFVELWALRVEEAERHLREGLGLARRFKRPFVALGCLGPLAEVAMMTNRQEMAEGLTREAIELADRLGWSDAPIVGVSYLVLSTVLNTWGRLDEGESWLDRAEPVLDGLTDPESSVVLPTARATLRFAQGRYEDALEHFRDAEQGHERLHSPHFLATSVRTWQLRALIRLGDMEPARRVLSKADGAARREAEWCNLQALLHLADGDAQKAVQAVEPVIDGSAMAVFHVNLTIEACLLEAVARDRLGQSAAAQRALERAIEVARPQGQVWIFLAVPECARLLEREPRTGTLLGAFVREVLERFAGVSHGDAQREALPEHLTDRECEVLRFLPTHLSAAEIGKELFLSVHTVKMHMRNLYAKLGVHRRADAVARARELGLLTPSWRRR
jgi:LuxR family transcriptional regulator, maltose regulon positive regulatory protein